jgi:hypothetical protein
MKRREYQALRQIANETKYSFDMELCEESTEWINTRIGRLAYKKGPLIVTLRLARRH